MRTTFKLLFILFFVASKSLFALDSWYQSRFQIIDSLQKEGLHREALPLFDSFYQKAFNEKNNVMLVRSIVGRNQNIAYLEEEPLVSILNRLHTDLPSLTAPVKQMVHSLLSEIYLDYYQQNRWRFHDRTAINGPVNNDIRTWDLDRISAEMIRHLNLSLQEETILQNTAVGSFSSLLEGDSLVRNLRPTLFDLLAHRALQLIENPETGLTRPVASFDMNREDFFSPAQEFVSINLSTSDTLSLAYQSMLVYQKITRFRLSDNNQEALTELELNRIDYVFKNSEHPAKDSLTIGFYEKLRSRNLSAESEAEVIYVQALHLFTQQIQEKGDRLLKALVLCNEVLERFPNTKAAPFCQQLKDKIEEPFFTLSAEAVELPERPFRTLIAWKNIESVALKLYKINGHQVNWFNRRLNAVADSLENFPVIREWEQLLPKTNDFTEHKAEIAVEGLPVGFYLLTGWHNSDKGKNKLQSIVSIQVSSLSLLSKNRTDGELLLVSHSESGIPVTKATIELHRSEYNQQNRRWEYKKDRVLQTDHKGELFLKPEHAENYLLKVVNAHDTLLIFNKYFNHFYPENEEQETKSIVFYTDRAIYRPGQTVQFRAIVLKNEGRKHSVVPGFRTTIVMRDANNQEVGSLNLTSNEFGTFSGNFTLPRSGLNGDYSLNCDYGSTSFRVEEYRRPTFEVNFDQPDRSYAFGDTISTSGMVKTYSGTPVDEARITYHITRREEALRWWWRPVLPEKVISHGLLTTGTDGRFSIHFPALGSDLDDRNRIMVFQVQIEATDRNGETRTNQFDIRISNTNLLIECDLPNTINLGEFEGLNIKTTNLNGKEVPSNVGISLYKTEAPDRFLVNRYWESPDTVVMEEKSFKKKFPNYPYRNENLPENWKKGKASFQQSYLLPLSEKIRLNEWLKADPGYYRVEIEAISTDGKQKNKWSQTVRLSTGHPSKAEITEDWVTAIKTRCQPGEMAEIWLTALHPNSTIRYELVRDNETVKSEILSPKNEVYRLLIPIEEDYRGNVSARFIQVANNRHYLKTVEIEVPHSDKKIDINFTTFRSQLLPGEKEQWGLSLTDHTGKGLNAEMVATLYDASLDQFIPHYWVNNFYQSRSNIGDQWNINLINHLGRNLFNPTLINFPVPWFKEYETLPLLNFNPGGYNHFYHTRGKGDSRIMIRGARSLDKSAEVSEVYFQIAEANSVSETLQGKIAGIAVADEEISDVPSLRDEIGNKEDAAIKTDFSQVQLRSNFNETAFFYPNLYSDNNGKLEISFTIPDAITRWRMMGFAHTKDFKTGNIEKELVTRKLVSVSAYAPRFLRDNDTLSFPAKISNLTDSTLTGEALLQWTDAIDFSPLTNKLIQGDSLIKFTLAPQSSVALNWKIIVPQGLQTVNYKVMAKTAAHSDGEQKTIPVLTNRQLVTESLPFMVRGGEKKELHFRDSALLTNRDSASLIPHSFTIEYTSNPAWYAIQSLPYLMEYPYECAEQIFSRLYANAAASALVNRSPKIKAVFDAWKMVDSGAFLSNLEKNSELKSVLLEESPWLLDAQKESESKKRVGLLFDLNRMGNELDGAFSKLEKMQNSNGGFSWFSGMPDNRYITQHIAKGMGEMKKMKIVSPKWEARWEKIHSGTMAYLNARITEDYNELLKKEEKDSTILEKYQPSVIQIHYLYTRSFNPEETLNGEVKTAFDYFFKQTQKHWFSYNEYTQGLLALTAFRFGDSRMAAKIVKSLADRAIHSKEEGMYWKNNRAGYLWYQSPIETQALMINVFSEINQDAGVVEEMKIWLLRNRQTTHWGNTKATLAACYAFLSQGYNHLDDSQALKIKIADKPLEELREIKPEAGTGYVKTVFTASEIRPEMDHLSIENPNRGMAWGAAYRQYFEQLDKIVVAKTDVEIRKQLYLKEKSEGGTKLKAITSDSPVKVGDEIVVRMEIQTLRDMEYVHLKDQRAAGFEPTSTLSGYQWQDGLGYYQEVKDAAVNFFIAYLPKGTFVFEYSLRASHAGQFSNGISTLQCMYAPEFTTHSEGKRIFISQ